MSASSFQLRAKPLTAAAFAPYGDVLAEGGRAPILVNEGRAARYDGLAHLAHVTGAEKPVISLYKVAPSRSPFAAGVFERHPLSSQVFLPMADATFLVVVAPDSAGRPDLARAEAFRPDHRTGIHYRAGIWHVPLVVFDAEAVFAMLMWETGRGDTEEHRLSDPILIDL